MKRRLYFLFPKASQVRDVIVQLNGLDLESSHMHTIARDKSLLEDLPQATKLQRNDVVRRIEWISWNANLVIFLTALLGLVVAMYSGSTPWALACVMIMAVTFALGEWFIDHVPNAHLNEFRDALAHGEILLMVDVPRWRVKEIEDYVHKRHPEAAVGGVGWTIERWGI